MATVYTVPATRDDTLYTVTDDGRGNMTCTCHDYSYRQGPRGGACKHIRRIETALRAQRAKAQIAALERQTRISAALDDLYA